VSNNRRIFASILVIASMTGVAKLAIVVRELVVAGYFGTSTVVDAFLIAFLLPNFAINVLVGSFNAAMMPTYIRVKRQAGIKAAGRLFSSVMLLGLLFLLAATLALSALAPALLPVLGSGFSDQSLAQTESLFRLLVPVLAITGVGRLYAMAMNAGEQFIVAALAPAVTPICAILALILFVDKWGINALAVGTVVGALLEMLTLAWAAKQRNVPLLPKWFGVTDELRIVIQQYTPMVAGAFLMSSAVLVDQAMAAMLSPGSVATLGYANKVTAMILGVGSMALGTAVLPHFSRMVADGDWSGLRHAFSTYARLISIICIPTAAILFMFSTPMIDVLFERGAFSAEDTAKVGQAQSFYVLQIPFYVLGILGVRLLSALSKNKVLMKISFVNLIVNIVGNYVLMQFWGVAGIALSTTLVYALSFIMIYSSLFRNLIGAERKHG